MTRLLVQLQGAREVARYELTQHRVILGRDSEEADLVIEELGVSRRHALLERRHGTTVLTDLGSANGTFLNGQAVSGSVSLESGDEIRLDAIAFVYLEEPSEPSSRWIGLSLVLLVSIAVLGGVLVSRYGLPPRGGQQGTSLRDATELASVGVAAWRRGDLSKAKRQIKAAYWTLTQGETLNDVPAGQLWQVGMRQLSESLGGVEDVGAIFEEVSARLEREQVRQEGGGRPTCRLDQVHEAELPQCLQAYVRFVLRELRQSDEGVPRWFYRGVAARLREERGSMEGRLARGEQYVPLMRRTLEEANLPPLLHYVAMAESAYQPKIGSSAGARGLWQFIKGTGIRYGLKIQGTIDERTDPKKSTAAAAAYLNDLIMDFGSDSLLLALAGYNRGEQGVRNTLHTLDDPWADRSYYALYERKLLPQETRNYPQRVFAQALAGEGGVPPPGRLEAAGY